MKNLQQDRLATEEREAAPEISRQAAEQILEPIMQVLPIQDLETPRMGIPQRLRRL